MQGCAVPGARKREESTRRRWPPPSDGGGDLFGGWRVSKSRPPTPSELETVHDSGVGAMGWTVDVVRLEVHDDGRHRIVSVLARRRGR